MSAVEMEVRSFQAKAADKSRDVFAESDGDLGVKLSRGKVNDNAGGERHSLVVLFDIDHTDTDVIAASDTRSLLDSLLAARVAIDLALAGMGVERDD
ncbi:MAG: hypothetical protein P1U38_09745 [Aeromicrobium sp.]|uniref:hypothetical protein n=1 Tax=Aeromicrobium sp. TaxID=1871063 RepID=UPI0026070B7F|nr:hypothetical protein [Aeromicrobium sp.]MDF1705044.1 hypothetical protein [Aeromicrobium sp.]